MKIFIPQPCHEKWADMTATAQGAFCKVCSKTVIDFTTMSDDEVKGYFINNAIQKTCGRFRPDQLTNNDLEYILSAPMPLWKKIVAAIFILFGPLLSSCSNNPTPNKAIDMQQQHTTGLPMHQQDTFPTLANPTFLPKPIAIMDTDTMYNDSIMVGEVIPEPIMGAPVEEDLIIDSLGLTMDSLRTMVSKDSTVSPPQKEPAHK